MFQLSKKKIVIIIAIWIILLLLTALATIYLNNKSNSSQENEKEVVAYYNTRSYYSFYNENNLKFETIYIDQKNHPNSYDYIKVSGLKNKKIENNINSELYNYAIKEKNNKAMYVHSILQLNAFNILSVEIQSSYENSNNKLAVFNYDLTTGNKIKFSDLFTNTANVSSIIYDGVYNWLSTNISFSILSLSRQIEAGKIYQKNGMESQYYSGVDIAELTKQKEAKEKELADVESLAFKETKKIYNDINNIEFNITNYGIIIYKDDPSNYITLKSKKNTEYFAFYEKYLTDDSIYEKNNIGKKNMFLSGNSNNYLKYTRIEEIGDYALIDYEKWEDPDDNEITYLDNKINVYKNKFDKNKFNYLNIESYYNSNTDSKITSINGRINLCQMSKDYYKNVYIKKLFEEKEHEEYWSNVYYSEEKENNIKCTQESLKAVVINDKIYENVPDIFIDNFDYRGYLIAECYRRKGILYDELDLDSLKKNFTFEFSYDSIAVDNTANNDSYYADVDIYIEINSIPSSYLKI